MTDTLKRLASPTIVAKGITPTSLLTVANTQIAKFARCVNTKPWDSYVWLSLGDMDVATNRIYNGVLVPALKTVDLPLDVIGTVGGSDIIYARQSPLAQDMFGNTALLQTPAVITNGTGDAGSASSVATGSWTEVNGQLYMLTVAWKKSTGAGTISSFTDTHTGISWQLVKTVTSNDGTQKLAVYVAVSGGTTATTTTVTFNTTQDGSAVAITSLAADGTFDKSSANGVEAIAAFGGAEDIGFRAVTTPLHYMDRYAPSNRVMSACMYGTRTTQTAGTGWTELNEAAANQSMTTNQMLASVGTSPTFYQPTWAAANGVALAIGVEVFTPIRPIAVSLYGVEVSA